MKLLMLGGTRFLGRHVIEEACARGHDVTLFHRGQSNPGLFPDLEHILGDRDGGLAPLRGRSWDAVVDTCGYFPRLVGASANMLAGSVGHYTFVSSGSVYPHPVPPGVDESGQIGVLEDPTVEEVTGDTYGPLKALCEQAAEREFPGRTLNVRAGLIVGPYDVSDRFTYWPMRVARGGPILAPVRSDLPVQFVDVRDLAAWMLTCAETATVGVFNATGPAMPLTLGDVLAACGEVCGSPPDLHWAGTEFLAEQGVELWSGLPLAVPEEDVGFSQVRVAKAVAAGLTFRPLTDTVHDTLAWAQTRPADTPLRAGITAEREAEVLAALAIHRRST